jgi:hypothetical protein
MEGRKAESLLFYAKAADDWPVEGVFSIRRETIGEWRGLRYEKRGKYGVVVRLSDLFGPANRW